MEPDQLELERLAAGVAYRVIDAEEVLQVPGRWHHLEAGIAVGEQARVAPYLPVKLTLLDDFAATLPMAAVSPPGGAGGATPLVAGRAACGPACRQAVASRSARVRGWLWRLTSDVLWVYETGVANSPAMSRLIHATGSEP